MITFRRINYVKFVSSLFLIIFFVFVIVYANKFPKWEEPLAVDASFIEWDDGISHEISMDAITIDIDSNDNGTIQYVVQPGDTLFKIASTFGTTVSTIQKVNTLKWEPQVWQTLKIVNTEDGIVYTVKDKTNVAVFANTYSLNVQDLMTLNYLADQSELLSPGQEIFINISKEKAYSLGLLEKPKPEIIPQTTITYKPVINKPSQWGDNKPVKTPTKITLPSADDTVDTSSRSSIISKWTYTKNITNGFARGQCTWYAAIISPNIFPYTDDKTQSREFGGNAGEWCTTAKAAWYKVGKKPAAGALIVYSNLRSSAGHVGKVINYYPDDGKVIVRDMNYAGRFIVTERWEDTSNAKIKCYIYWK